MRGSSLNLAVEFSFNAEAKDKLLCLADLGPCDSRSPTCEVFRRQPEKIQRADRICFHPKLSSASEGGWSVLDILVTFAALLERLENNCESVQMNRAKMMSGSARRA